ncbi:MAG: Rrf2 family transcriptional regulator [Candidatus Lindowbacteria bacterium]|nr:Rrf2 family transcriptional regulator [Candidatus Lindowbacteria bacterium]
MKISSQEEYGLRCLLTMSDGKPRTLQQIGDAEQITTSHAAKLMRLLRQGGFVRSSRGQSGGYKLVRDPSEINVGDVLGVLGGKLVEGNFCETHAGTQDECVRTQDCSIKYLWVAVQGAVDTLLQNTTLKDLMVSKPVFHMGESSGCQCHSDGKESAQPFLSVTAEN